MQEKHKIELAEDKYISAVHHTNDSDKWVFFCHGFGSNKEGSYENRCNFLVKKGYNCVRFDFRGNGDSSGRFIDQSLSSKISDLKNVIDYFEPGNYILFGSSFGGKAVFHASTDLDPEAIVVRAPVTYNSIMSKYKAVVEEKGEFTHHEGATIDNRFFEDFSDYSFKDVEKEIKCPISIFHGSDDTTVHIENSFEAAEDLQTDVTIHKIDGEKHSFSDNAEKYMMNQISGWLNTI